MPPNILMIVCHDLGQHLGCYGAGLSTPNIDALAGEGVRFTNYHCSAAQCSPSRGSIMTGRYPHRNGLMGLAHLGWGYNPSERTLAMCLADAGYETTLIGAQHETSGDPHRLGYQNILSPSLRIGDLAEVAFEFLEGHKGSGTPFFACMGTFEVHRPYETPGYAGDDPADITPLPWLPDTPGIRADIADLNGMVYAVDAAVGGLRMGLESSGLTKDTLLILTTDHGLAMPRAKGTCFDPGTKTTLIMRQPGRFDSGAVQEELLSNCDLLPTLCDVAGASEPDDLDGRSFLPLLDGRPYEQRDSVFAEMTWHDLYNPMRAIRTTTHRYIRNFGDLPRVYLPRDIWMGRAGQDMREDYYGSRRPEEELYDLAADPLEQTNVADAPENATLLADLRGRVDAWMRETGDRLLDGHWPACEKQKDVIHERAEADAQSRWIEQSRGTLLQSLGV